LKSPFSSRKITKLSDDAFIIIAREAKNNENIIERTVIPTVYIETQKSIFNKSGKKKHVNPVKIIAVNVSQLKTISDNFIFLSF